MKLTVFKTIRYYFRVWLATLRLSLSKAVAFRLEVIVRILRGIMLVGIQIIFIKAVIGNGDNIAGWSEDQMYLLSGVFNMINYFSWAFFAINHWRIEEKILKGEFDVLLLKPLSSIFSASFPDFFIDEAMTAISGFFLIVYYFARNIEQLTLLNILFGLVAIACAFVVWFSLELIFASFDFIQVKNGLREIKKNLTNAGRFPMEIWSSNAQFIFYTFFPIAFVSVVPAGLLAGRYDWRYAVLAILVSATFLLIARKFWYFALTKYSGQGGN
jgi:ABC-2 type transport system permease protein